jgi:hypothetical protein
MLDTGWQNKLREIKKGATPKLRPFKYHLNSTPPYPSNESWAEGNICEAGFGSEASS